MEIPFFSDEVIWTSFSRPILQINPGDCRKTFPKDYTEYQLFSLRTWAISIFKKYFGPFVEIDYQSIKKDDKMYLTMVPVISNEKINIDKKLIKDIQQEIDNVKTLNSLLIIIDEPIIFDNGIFISPMWVEQILQYINIDYSISQTNENVRYLITGNQIILYLENIKDYHNIYIQISEIVHQKLKQLFLLGIVYKPPSEIIDNWELKPIDFGKDIYHIDWEDNRLIFGYKTKYDFIISRMHGIEYIDIKLNIDDYTLKHLIVIGLSQLGIGLSDFLFYPLKLRINCNNLKLAKDILYTIDNVKLDKRYLAKVLYLKNRDEISINEALKNEKISECYYRIADNERPLIYSRLVNI